MKHVEHWPWHDAESGHDIQENRWYGFSDGGGLVGDSNGYNTAQLAYEGCLAALGTNISEAASQIKWWPSELGYGRCCILSGRQYVDRLYELCAPGGSGWDLYHYGHWQNQPQAGVCEARKAFSFEAASQQYMSNIREREARAQLANMMLRTAVCELESLGFIVTVRQQPTQPPRMGGYITVVETRPKRGTY